MNRLIKEFEGCKLTAYKCPAGIWTIGWGHTGSDVKEGLKIDLKRAEELYMQDTAKLRKYIDKTKFNKNQIEALESFAYNCGVGALQKVLQHMKEGETFATAAIRYVKAGGKVIPGLVRRRKAEIALFGMEVK